MLKDCLPAINNGRGSTSEASLKKIICLFWVGDLIFCSSQKTQKKQTDNKQTNKSRNFDKMKIGSPHHHKFSVCIQRSWLTKSINKKEIKKKEN